MFSIKFSPDIDWILIGIVLFLCTVGLISIYSASAAYQSDNNYFAKQFLWLGIGFGAMVFFTLLDYRLLVRWAWSFYFLLLIALIYVLYSSNSSGLNVNRWIVVSGLNIQPSEFATEKLPRFRKLGNTFGNRYHSFNYNWSFNIFFWN